MAPLKLLKSLWTLKSNFRLDGVVSVLDIDDIESLLVDSLRSWWVSMDTRSPLLPDPFSTAFT